MKPFKILFFIAIISVTSQAQGKFGIELRSGRYETYNSGRVLGYSYEKFYGCKIIKEGNPTTTSYSFGLLYKLTKSLTTKLHIGKHQNGRILDLVFFDEFTYNMRNDEDWPFHYFQICPSFSYRFIDKNFGLPIEVGIAVNKALNEKDASCIFINEYNYDVRLSLGIDYQIMNFKIGSNFIFSNSLKEYQREEIMQGQYTPYQLGMELSVGFYLRVLKD